MVGINLMRDMKPLHTDTYRILLIKIKDLNGNGLSHIGRFLSQLWDSAQL